MYAVAQKKFTYIYDEFGVELHLCKDFKSISMLRYLPYHFLLTGCVIFNFLTLDQKRKHHLQRYLHWKECC
jgi:U3 small nucleolar RNA-associated protein 7